ncbi:hypothetical protein [Bosea sp. 2RAB26]|uniref:hypothetical protein n=1 Tax=Bosea sp. 2RAB26 TaxID=3237476 RepID=UPI003F8F520C
MAQPSRGGAAGSRAADEDDAALVGGGGHAMPWHWQDCLMFMLPSRGTITFR